MKVLHFDAPRDPLMRDFLAVPRSVYAGDPSAPGLPDSIYGLKFDLLDTAVGQAHVEFDSIRIPVLGSFYAKDGKWKVNGAQEFTYAFNTGLADAENGMFIYVPDSDTVVPVPEPGTYAMLGTFLFACGLARTRRRTKVKA